MQAPDLTLPRAPKEPEKALRILFSLLHPGYLRPYGEPIRLLARRGHHVHIALGRLEKDAGDKRLIEQLAADHPNVTYGLAPVRPKTDGWDRIGWLARALTDLTRYANPRYADSPALRGRIANRFHWRIDARRMPGPLKRILHRAVDRLSSGNDALLAERMRRRLARLEDAVPASRRITRFVREQQPDAVLASPVVEFASTQVEYLKAARQLGIRTGVCVASWDNLTGKGLLRLIPDRVIVWNEIQRGELAEMHGVPPERVVLTGAQRFDEWFGRSPSTSPTEFKRKVGLDPVLPYVLYLCSSPFIAEHEVPFIRRWAAAIRGSDSPELSRLGLLIRPHPQNGRQWRGADLSELGNAVVWPPEGAQPDAGEMRSGYFDSLVHSACVVGVNSSSLIEAGIAGKAVLTVLDDDFAGTQEGTLHFHYLRWENDGLLRVARDFDEHLEQLARAVEGGPEDIRQVTRFVERFCRPHGLDRPAAPLVAGAIEELARLGPVPHTLPRTGTVALRTALYPVASLLGVVARVKAAIRWIRRHVEYVVRGPQSVSLSLDADHTP